MATSDPRNWTQETWEAFNQIVDQQLEQQFPGYLAEREAEAQRLANLPSEGTWEEIIREREGGQQ